MTREAENLQDAIGLIKDEYILEAHGEEAAAQAAEAATSTVTATTGKPAAASPEAATNAAEPTNGKVIQMPPQRKKRKATGPIAIAACLVLALGVGALAITNTNKATSVKETETTEDVSTTSEREAASSALMATEADGAHDGAGSTTDSYNMVPGHTEFPYPAGEAFVLTAGVWNDNDNWPFFTNLVNSGTISFPSFGLDPTNRVKATITDAAGHPVRNEEVALLDDAGNVLWRAVSGKDGAAYLFYGEGQTPAKVAASDVEQSLIVRAVDSDGQQGEPSVQQIDDVSITVDTEPMVASQLQVMFIVDTTGSMTDEIAYLQKDFAAIAADAGNDGIEYSVNFYRDEGDDYVTKTNGFTNDISAVQALLNAEFADGGGDTPEAVADILAETITNNGAWRADCNKVAFLIFDAPPHDGTDATIEAAVDSAAAQGIRLVPVVASNADRATELFGRALAIMTDGTYVFLTDDSGVGDSHLEPIVGDYTVELLHDVIVRIINDNR